MTLASHPRAEFLRSHIGKIPEYDDLLEEIAKAYEAGRKDEWANENLHRADFIWNALMRLARV
jgi:hypothetical protein